MVWREAPALVAAMDNEASLDLDRLSALDLLASDSELCRQTALRLVARNQGAIRDFEIELAQSRPAWSGITHFNTTRKAAWRSYISELGPCITAAPSRDRRQLVDNMLRF